MLATIRDFFEKNLSVPKETVAPDPQRARLAAAALLVEVIHADEHLTDTERNSLLGGLSDRFGLDHVAAGELMSLAREEVRLATDLYQFTAQINRHFDFEQKQWLIEELWRMAYADQTLHRHEEYLVRKIADLIHVPNTAVMIAKHKVQSGRPGA